MKALKITLTHGRIWTVETSSGARAQSSTPEGALDQLLPANWGPVNDADGYAKMLIILDAIPDSGGDGNIGHGVKSA